MTTATTKLVKNLEVIINENGHRARLGTIGQEVVCIQDLIDNKVLPIPISEIYDKITVPETMNIINIHKPVITEEEFVNRVNKVINQHSSEHIKENATSLASSMMLDKEIETFMTDLFNMDRNFMIGYIEELLTGNRIHWKAKT